MNVFEKIGNTPMIQYHGEVPNGNRIYFKLECENPFGSHYDRVYPALYKHYEEKGRLVPGATVLETTSGSAGVSFAGIGRRLGYKCIVAIPACTENAREEAIKQEGAELINTPADVYVKGFPPFLKRYLVKNRHVIFLNHSMGEFGIENTVTTSSLESIAVEAQKKLGSIDYYVAAVGNGSTVLDGARIAVLGVQPLDHVGPDAGQRVRAHHLNAFLQHGDAIAPDRVHYALGHRGLAGTCATRDADHERPGEVTDHFDSNGEQTS